MISFKAFYPEKSTCLPESLYLFVVFTPCSDSSLEAGQAHKHLKKARR